MIHNNFQTLFIFFIFKTQTSSTLTKHHSQVEHFYFSENRFITQCIYPLSSNNTIQNWKRKKKNPQKHPFVREIHWDSFTIHGHCIIPTSKKHKRKHLQTNQTKYSPFLKPPKFLLLPYFPNNQTKPRKTSDNRSKKKDS